MLKALKLEENVLFVNIATSPTDFVHGYWFGVPMDL